LSPNQSVRARRSLAVKTNGAFTPLYSFSAIHTNKSGAYTNKDGYIPSTVLISSGVLYGTTILGGTNGNGTVFAISTNGTGFTKLYTFMAASLPVNAFKTNAPSGTNSDGAFPPQKGKGQPVGIPAQPQGLSVSHGPQLSQLVAKINPVFGAVIYNYRLLANTPGAVPVIAQDTAATHTFAGLIAGVKYTIDVSASGTGGTASDWSGAISLTAN
jgi:uncharacterized repeat protein (TIGR03803 family)